MKFINYIIKNKYKLFIFSLLLLCILKGTQFISINKTVYNQQYLTQYTYYYPSDATGSSNCTSSNKCISDFTTDSNGWYHYNYNGKDYLVVAAALKKCRDDNNHCGIDINKHGIATTINYYNLYDTLTLTISGKTYDALVLDACGACMWKRQDERGQELFDIFVQNGSAKNPGGGNSKYIGNIGNNYEHFGTIYDGDLTQGWIYKRFDFVENVDQNFPEYKVEQNINEVIDEIFNRAKTTYFSVSDYSGGGNGSSYDAKSCEEVENISGFGSGETWRQGNKLWGGIKIGSTNLATAGCLVTSIAIQINRMGADTGIANFNPGTFACYLSKKGQFTSGGALYGSWANTVSNVAQVSGKLTGSRVSQASQAQDLINSGCYLVVYAPYASGTRSHFVAVSGTTSDNIKILDPGAGKPTLWPYYDYNSETGYRCLKVG